MRKNKYPGDQLHYRTEDLRERYTGKGRVVPCLTHCTKSLGVYSRAPAWRLALGSPAAYIIFVPGST